MPCKRRCQVQLIVFCRGKARTQSAQFDSAYFWSGSRLQDEALSLPLAFYKLASSFKVQWRQKSRANYREIQNNKFKYNLNPPQLFKQIGFNSFAKKAIYIIKACENVGWLLAVGFRASVRTGHSIIDSSAHALQWNWICFALHPLSETSAPLAWAVSGLTSVPQ